MVKITKEIEFDYGHRIPNHDSLCFSPHGHRGRVVVCVEGNINTRKGSADEGMVVDFKDLKIILKECVHDHFDHSFLVYEHDLFYECLLKFINNCNTEEYERLRIRKLDYIPTAENIAKDIYERINNKIHEVFTSRVTLCWVKFYETPTSSATYSE